MSTSDGAAADQTAASRSPSMPGERQLAGGEHEHREAEEQRRLGEGRHGDLPAGAHALEARSGVQPGQHQRETPSPSRPANATRSPVKLRSAECPSSGSSVAATSTVASTTIGPIRKTSVVVRL